MVFGVKVPCGYSAPGSLPQPLEGGVDGGFVGNPTEPPTGGFNGTFHGSPLNPGAPAVPGPVTPGTPNPPTIIDITTTVDTSSVIITVITDIPTTASATVIDSVTGDIQVYSNPSFVTQVHIISFTNLTDETTFTYGVTVIETSPFKVSTTTNGTFTTLENTQTQPPGDTSSITSVGVLSPFDPTSNPNMQNTNTGVLYSGFLVNSTYGDNELDLKYTPYNIVPTKFAPVYSQTNLNIFSPIRHLSLENVLKAETTAFEVANLDKENITPDSIKKSLEPSLRKILYSLKYPNGVPVPDTTVSQAIKSIVLNNDIDLLSVSYIKNELKQYATSINVSPFNSASPTKRQYGTNVSYIKDSRKVTTTNITQPVTRSQQTGFMLLKKSLQSLDANAYTDDSKELLKLWYFLPSDINKRLEYLDENDEIVEVFINNDESFTILDENDVLLTKSVTINDFVVLLDANDEEYFVYTADDRSRAKILNNYDDHLIKYHLGVEDNIIFTASSVNRSIEFEASSPGTISDHYILVLDSSSVTNSYSDTSPFIIESTANYVLKEKTQEDIDLVNGEIKYRAYPWLTLALNQDDPMFEYFEDASGINNRYSFAFKDITYNRYAGVLDTFGDIIPRRIPKFILILPTDKTKFNLFSGKSYLTDWNVRQAIFTKAVDKNLTSVGLLNHPLQVENTYLNSSGESKSGYFDTLAYHCKYSTSTPTFSQTYNNPASKPARKENPFRKVLKVITSLKNNFNYSEGLTYYDVLSRLERRELYGLNTEATATVLNKLSFGDQTGVRLLHVKGPQNKNLTARRSPTRLISLVDGGVDEYKSKYSNVDLLSTVATAKQSSVVDIGGTQTVGVSVA